MKSYDDYLEVIEQTLAHTETEWGPWTIVEATDSRWAKFRVFSTLVERFEERPWGRGIEPPDARQDADAVHADEERLASGDRLDEQEL